MEVLDRIEATLRAKGEDALAAHDVKRPLRKEYLGSNSARSFVVSHLQLGLLLQNLGAPLTEPRNERAGVYLTNALNGWKPPEGPKSKYALP